ncbi:GNAT family N-acetyltransferase [Paenibacillus guangzhouensis]|uniref:GNAT family N-acetyltransferase n=1 Tax=Paenibacillus guangzhouensis TaxID=1473112 RepID=UPI0012671826|nr:GNAT family N-acetyltransferase [Paenibacillus guangzhouensis]
MNVRLSPTTRDNWQEAMQLQVQEEQSPFVASVVVSLAKVHIRPDGEQYQYAPYNLYNDEGRLIGFIMTAVDDTTTWSYWVTGFIIDAKEQGQGYGRAALQAAIDHIRAQYPQCERVNLTAHADNTRARRLYENYGFTATGEVYDGEVVYRYDLGSSR